MEFKPAQTTGHSIDKVVHKTSELLVDAAIALHSCNLESVGISADKKVLSFANSIGGLFGKAKAKADEIKTEFKAGFEQGKVAASVKA